MGHTPGPWYGKVKSGDQGLIADENTGKTIAICYDQRDTQPIAAVPKLLEALSRLCVCCGEANALQHSGLNVPEKVWAEMYQANNVARAVIAEAEGKEC